MYCYCLLVGEEAVKHQITATRHGVNAREPAEARDGGTPTANCHVRSPRRSRGGRSPAALHLLRGGLGVGDGATRPRGRGTQTQPSRGLQGLRKLRAPGPAARAATPSTHRPSAPPPPSPPLSRPKARRFPDSARPSAHPAPAPLWRLLLFASRLFRPKAQPPGRV
ncbi:TPA: hypothetical protein BOS_6422 [Bos taurus]|nr:TPA: hypothetical protein BOS_6422 [Bos taurus]